MSEKLEAREVIEQILGAVGSDPNDVGPIMVALRLAGFVIVPRGDRQKLVDIVFATALAVAAPLMPREECVAYVARQLRECGFPTEPRGSSHGVLIGG